MKTPKHKIEIVLNKSLTYFLPMVDTQVHFNHLHLMRNCYLSGDGKEGEFSVLYEWSSNPIYIAWEKELMENHLYVGHEDYNTMVLYKFRLSKEMREARDLFINGKYSMFIEKHKEAINDFLKRRNASNRNKINKILNRDESLRLEMNEKLKVKIDPNSELSSKPNMFNEDFYNFVQSIKIVSDNFLNEDEE